MLVLKPLDQAVQDNDVIHAVVAGTGLNQDGKTAGITTPSGEAQGSFSLHPRTRMAVHLADLPNREAYSASLREGRH